MKYDILIVGCGPAGMYASVYGILHNKKICIIESTNSIGGQPTLLYAEKKIDDIPGKISIRAGSYAQELIEQFEYYKNDYQLFLETRLESWTWDYNEQSYICILSNNQTVVAKYIIFATGLGEFIPKKLTDGTKEYQNERIHYIVKKLSSFKDKKVIIFGGGDSAIDWANILVEDEITNHVSIVHRSNKYRALEKNTLRLKQNNINEFLNYSLKDIDKDKVIITSNEQNGQEISIQYDEIICMYGVEPKNNLKVNSEIFEMKANKFVVNRWQQTKVKHIYAIGQASYYENRPNLIVVAQAEAAIAIKTINNEERLSTLNKK